MNKKTGIPSKDPDYHAKYRALHRDRLKKLARDYRRNSSARLWSAAKIRAKQKNLPFDIEVADIIIPEYCPVLGIPLSVGNGQKHHGSPSIDKFIPELGYVKSNIRVISDRANTLKSDGTIGEFEKILRYMKNG